MTVDVGSCWDEAPFGPGQSNGLLCELPSGHAGAHRAGDAEWMIRGPQGEPSDAQVKAAMKEASRRSLMWRTSSDVRAVLMAAFAVTEQGENR